MQKAVQIVVGKTLERPPLNSCGQYYKLYLQKDIVIDKNQYKCVNSARKYYEPYYFKDNIQATTFRNYWQIFTKRQQVQRSYH